MSPAATARPRPTSCWRAMAAPGARSTEPSAEAPMAEKRKISLVLADVDGTLVTEEKVLTERARRPPFRRLRDAGIRFAITSGRPPRGMAMLFDPLELDTPIAGFNGGLFVKRDLSIIEQKTLPADVAAKAIELIRGARSRCLGLSRQRLADHQGRRAARRPRGLDGQVRAEGRGGLRRRARPGRQDRRRQRRSRQGRRCEADAQAAFGERATANRSQPYYLDVTHKDANKGAVVEYLSQPPGRAGRGDRHHRRPAERRADVQAIGLQHRHGQRLRRGEGAGQRHDAIPTTTRASPRRWSASCLASSD